MDKETGMTPMKEQLKVWCRYAHVDDTKDNGICKFTLKFKIRDEDMETVFAGISYFDLCDVAEHVLDTVCPGCEGYADDWKDPDSPFNMYDEYVDGFIVLEGEYRT